jgi:RimJ/RimL family protein N-acetyltransferase
MSDSTPIETIRAFAKTIHGEARKYGFDAIDMVRLINELMDLSTEDNLSSDDVIRSHGTTQELVTVTSFPLQSRRLEIRLAEPDEDAGKLKDWINDEYGRHFLMSCATAQSLDVDALLHNSRNQVGIVHHDNVPIGAVAYLDIDPDQKRAELRKLIGDPDARGKGYAEEATRLWIKYGYEQLGLEKIYVSTLQTNLRNISLNEAIGFRVEGILHGEVLISNERYDVLRMGLCLK